MRYEWTEEGKLLERPASVRDDQPARKTGNQNPISAPWMHQEPITESLKTPTLADTKGQDPATQRTSYPWMSEESVQNFLSAQFFA
jgi:hypothetical protein